MLWMFMLFAVYFAPFYLAFSTKTHSILQQNTLRLAANSPETAANGSFST